MAQVSIGLDTETGTCVLVVDSVVMSPESVYFSKSKNFDGSLYTDFSYSVKSKDANGLEEHVMYRMPHPEDDSYGSRKNGLVAEEVRDTELVKKDIADFITNR